jgi:glycosyltransferase involved in cell wall biosynthesis
MSDFERDMKKRVCFVAAVEITVKAFLLDHIRTMGRYFDISVAVNTGNTSFLKPYGIETPVIPVGIERGISPFADLKALFELYRLFRKERYDVIHSVTPKAGLLSMLAGFFAGIPIRIHTFTGQVWATRKGTGRWVLKTMDRILVACATHVLVDSPSQRTFLVEQGVVSGGKAHVIAAGSICGVDAGRFSPNSEARDRIRRQYGISESDIVFLYLGRLNRDKGLLDLAGSFSQVCNRYGNTHLIIVGSDEQRMKGQIESICTSCSQKIHFEDYTDVPEHFIAAADVFCLPSYREGFGVVVIQAASAGIPSIGSRIYGIADTIEDGITGLLFKTGDQDDLALKMKQFLDTSETIKQMGKEARKRTLQLYAKETVTTAMLDYYKKITGIV